MTEAILERLQQLDRLAEDVSMELKQAAAQLKQDPDDTVAQAEYARLTAEEKGLDATRNRLSESLAGQSAQSNNAQEVASLQRQVKALQVKVNHYSNTTQYEAALGEVHLSTARQVSVGSWSWLPIVTEPQITSALAAWKKKFRNVQNTGRMYKRPRNQTEPSTHPSTSLADLADYNPETQARFTKEDHMQPTVYKLLSCLAAVMGGKMRLVDTHSSSNRLSQPFAQPDCCSLVSALLSWTQVGVFWEFKLATTDRDVAWGQQVERFEHGFAAQPSREYFVGVNVFMDGLEVMVAHYDRNTGGIRIDTTNVLSFFMGRDSDGFRLLLRVLAATREQVGFRATLPPRISKLNGVEVSGMQLLRKGSRDRGSGSHVFKVTARVGKTESAAVLKLNRYEHETSALRTMQEVPSTPYTVHLVSSGSGMYEGLEYRAVLIQPYATLLSEQDNLQTVTQVSHDVAVALRHMVRVKRLLHRDIQPGNFGKALLNGVWRGCVFDFSASKFVTMEYLLNPQQTASPTGQPHNITGTVSSAALHVLRGGGHSESTMLESTAISVLSISCKHKLEDAEEMSAHNLQRSAKLRQGAFTMPELSEVSRGLVSPQLKPLVVALHNLFYPLSTPYIRGYRTDVTAEEFIKVCKEICPTISTEADG